MLSISDKGRKISITFRINFSAPSGNFCVCWSLQREGRRIQETRGKLSLTFHGLHLSCFPPSFMFSSCALFNNEILYIFPEKEKLGNCRAQENFSPRLYSFPLPFIFSFVVGKRKFEGKINLIIHVIFCH
jgi:hypothetical protein